MIFWIILFITKKNGSSIVVHVLPLRPSSQTFFGVSGEAMSLMSACWKTPQQNHPSHQPYHTLYPDLQLATKGPQHRWQFESSIAWAHKPLAKRFGLGAGTAVATHGAQFQGEALRFPKTEMVFLLGEQKWRWWLGGWFGVEFWTSKTRKK